MSPGIVDFYHATQHVTAVVDLIPYNPPPLPPDAEIRHAPTGQQLREGEGFSASRAR